MNVEELLQTLRDSGLEDEAIKNLLSEALASLDNNAPAEIDAASDLLGVEL